MRLLIALVSIVFAAATVSTRSCTFTHNPLKGGSIYSDSTTVRVAAFTNNASLAKATLPQTMAEALRDAIQSQTKMNLVPRGGDLVYEGTITGYSISPVSIQAGNTQAAALNRLTIVVSVKFTDTKDETKNFETAFSRFADYNSTQNLSAVEDELIKDISSQLVQDILNRSINNW